MMEADLLEKEHPLLHRAEQLVFCDLINALLQENLAGLLDRARIERTWPGPAAHECSELGEGEQYLRLPLGDERSLVVRVKAAPFIQPYKLSRLPAVLVDQRANSVQELTPISFMQRFADALSAVERQASMPNLQDFQQELRDSIRHTALSMQASTSLEQSEQKSDDAALLQAERFSAMRDRPFHPTSRAKRGWSDEDYRTYSAEYGRAFGLDWLAVRRDYVQASTAQDVADFILDEAEKARLRQAVREAGIDEQRYLLMPVHPWQTDHVLPAFYREELAQCICVPVVRGLGAFRPTSSVRALVPAGRQRYHVKVPIGIYSLGALRLLPPRYLYNGAKGQQLLVSVAEKDERLRQRLRLCDETNWWGYHDAAADPFADKPGHLACLIREYPADLLRDDAVQLIPMSGLAVVDPQGKNPVFAAWLRARYGEDAGVAEVLQLFREICHMLIDTSLRLFCYGIMPEIHGQNVLLIVRDHQTTGLLLRDHDTIRLHLPWLAAAGLQEPAYRIKPGTPNSLINETPEKLLSYFQTLGVQVNLYAIADALMTAYAIEEAAFWRVIMSVVRESLGEEGLPEQARDVWKTQLLEADTWPIRLLLTPLLQRTDSGGGSMPAGVGSTSNPLRQLEAADE